MALSKAEVEVFNLRFQGVRAEIQAKDDLILQTIESNSKTSEIILNQILAQTKKTNGRVTDLEECKEIVDKKIISLENNQSIIHWIKEKPVKRFIGVYLVLVIPILAMVHFIPRVLTWENIEKIIKLLS
uniref:Uncharacterized protein n=1 Tax=uncultured marine virus TaxID=186617 RepID=A0A0F7L905_9VIRU|nr:hypothetical protein [uncultured marine virus]